MALRAEPSHFGAIMWTFNFHLTVMCYNVGPKRLHSNHWCLTCQSNQNWHVGFRHRESDCRVPAYYKRTIARLKYLKNVFFFKIWLHVYNFFTIYFRHINTLFLLQTRPVFWSFQFCLQSDEGLQISSGKNTEYQWTEKLNVKRCRHKIRDCWKFSRRKPWSHIKKNMYSTIFVISLIEISKFDIFNFIASLIHFNKLLFF